ncbi:MAG: S-adenosylmethionine:tRNA ribosyltransferase-isomerase [Bacteroidales bacterium]|nr:S-adenosylmethionine:tRNA ribosyltransferase-isomerase [Bacteroidales bacterium]
MNLQLHISEFEYNLPAERIALFPAAERDFSKLLLYERGQAITHDRFRNLANHLTQNTLLVFNDTRVIHARILFTSNTGNTIELFCLKPVDPSDYETAFKETGECIWECLVGNLRKWKDPMLIQYIHDGKRSLELKAEMLSKTSYGYLIRFSWPDSSVTFGEVLERAGIIPLPPYIKRPPVETDDYRYQTIYAKDEGSVAAPTAGLHFTEDVLLQLRNKNILSTGLILHVGAGTFLPVKSGFIIDHPMHAEQFSVQRKTLEILLNHSGSITAVGTTTVRTLESLYWLGNKLSNTGKLNKTIDQWEPYEIEGTLIARESIEILHDYMLINGLEEITASTRIMIIPGYKYQIVDQLITNFHQPRSTLLLLVAAFIGEDWKKVYQYALENDFRFLSYGDSSLLIP